MFHFVTATFHRLIESLAFSQTRYLYPSFNLRNRLTGLIGPRGVGKTTLLLQYIKNELFQDGKCFYFSADLVYFQQSTLLEFVSDLHLVEGYQVIFIDEIHKYQAWNQELKNLYDAFPSLKVVFSGSSMLDLIEGSHDLSRRAKLYRLHGLSFREYLNFNLDLDLKPIRFQDMLEDTNACLKQLKGMDRILPHFEDYLKNGYYPFVFEDPNSYFEKVSRVIDKTVFEDIANYYNLKTPNLHYFKKLLTYLASIPPGDLNIHNLAKSLGIDHKTVEHYVSILASVGLIREMRPFEGGSPGLRKPSKILLNNTNLIHTLQQYLGQQPSKGMERELFFIQSLQNADVEIFYSKQADYRTSHFRCEWFPWGERKGSDDASRDASIVKPIDKERDALDDPCARCQGNQTQRKRLETREAVFEIGGKNKTRDQLKGLQEPSYLVKDNILHSLKGEIPLFLFGFLY